MTSTSTSTPTPTRRSPVRRGTALAAVTTMLTIGAGSAVLGAPAAQARSQFSGCTYSVAKQDPAGHPLPGASFQVATADGARKLITPAQAGQVGVQYQALVAPYQALVNADNTGVGVSSYGFLRDDANGATPAQKVFDVQASIDVLAAYDAAAQANPIPSSAAAGFDTSAISAFMRDIHTQLAAERRYAAAGGTAPVSTITPAPGADRRNFPNLNLEAAIARSRMILVQQALPAPIAAQLAALSAPFEVASVKLPTRADGTIGIVTADTTGPADPSVTAVIEVDSGPTVGGVTVPLTITETVAPQGFALDTTPQSLPVGFDACLATTPPAGSPMWTVTNVAPAGRDGRVVTVTLRDALAAVVVPPVTTPPVTTPPVVTPPVVTPPVTPPVAVVPPVVPVVTPAPVTPAPAGVAIAVPVAPAPQAVARFAPPRGVDAGLAPAADATSTGQGQRVFGGLLAASGLTAAGSLLVRRRRH